jgi:hypothetical protein
MYFCSRSHFTKNIQVIVARCAVGAESHLHSGGKHIGNRCNARCEFQVALNAVGNCNTLSGQEVYFPVINPYAMSGKQSITEKANAFEVFNRPFAIAVGKLGNLPGRLR